MIQNKMSVFILFTCCFIMNLHKIVALVNMEWTVSTRAVGDVKMDTVTEWMETAPVILAGWEASVTSVSNDDDHHDHDVVDDDHDVVDDGHDVVDKDNNSKMSQFFYQIE